MPISFAACHVVSRCSCSAASSPWPTSPEQATGTWERDCTPSGLSHFIVALLSMQAGHLRPCKSVAVQAFSFHAYVRGGLANTQSHKPACVGGGGGRPA